MIGLESIRFSSFWISRVGFDVWERSEMSGCFYGGEAELMAVKFVFVLESVVSLDALQSGLIPLTSNDFSCPLTKKVVVISKVL